MTKIGFQNQEHLLVPNEVTHALKRYYDEEKDCVGTIQELQDAIKAFPLIIKPAPALVDIEDLESALMD
jgi:hypothetical protein